MPSLVQRFSIPVILALSALICAQTAKAEDPLYEEEFIFDPAVQSHGHCHASAIVECPNGDLRTVWYENGPALPSPPFYSDNRDKSADVRIGGARKPSGAKQWEPTFVMFDTFGVSDNNPTMVIDAQKRLWVIHPTMLAAPGWTWGSSILQYHVSSDYLNSAVPKWEDSNLLLPQPAGFAEAVEAQSQQPRRQAPRADATEQAKAQPQAENPAAQALQQQRADRGRQNSRDPLRLRLGWMPRAHALIRHDGMLILPLSNENFGIAVMAMTNDGGKSWSYSQPVPGGRVTQPSLVEFPDGTMQAYFRNGDPHRRIKRSTSTDGGLTWTPLELTDRPNPGSGLEAMLLKNGHVALVYNNKERDPRDKLAISISADGGKTWGWTRQIEDTAGGRFDYPSITQAKDGTIHVSYTFNTKTIKHVRFNEAWVQASPEKPAAEPAAAKN